MFSLYWHKLQTSGTLNPALTLRVQRLSALLCVGLLTLSACAKKGELESEEVLRRSALASKELRSSRYHAVVDVAMGRKEARNSFRFDINGVLQEGGAAHQMEVAVSGKLTEAGEQYTLQGKLNVIVSPGDVYLRIDELAVDPPHPSLSFAPLEAIRGRWVRMPASESSSLQTGVTPDPSFLRAQAQVITVTRDKGLQNIHGRDAYSYDVALNKEKLFAFLRASAAERNEAFDSSSAEAFATAFSATGGLWIDAADFFVHRLTWDMESKADDGLTAKIDVEFTDHNKAPGIVPPPQAELMSSGSLLAPFLPSSSPAPKEQTTSSAESSVSVPAATSSSSL